MNNINILILEDELIIYMHITKTLKLLGFKNIFTARSSKEALDIASNTKIDILFSDIKIEGEVDGIETASVLQSIYGMAVIFITAYKDKKMLERVSKIDTVGYLLKPYRPDELETLIELAILRYGLNLENRLIKIDKNHSFDKKDKKLFYQDKEVRLTKKENIFISILIKNLNEYVSYELLESLIWYDEIIVDSSKRTFYSRVRQKFPELSFKTQRALGIGVFTKSKD